MNRLLLSCFLLFFCKASLAAGWTGYGSITSINQQPAVANADFYVLADLPNVPTTCPNKGGFHLNVVSARDERVLALVMSAFIAEKPIMLYVSDTCSAGRPTTSGVYVKH